MRILIVGLNFAPEPIGVGKYTGEMAQWLASCGHDVSVITTRPYYPDWNRANGLRRPIWQRETWNGCRVIRCPLYVPRQITGFRRLVHLSSFAISSVPAAVASLGKQFDVVGGIVPTLLSAPVALAVARLSKAKAWLHVQDLEFDAAHRLGIVTNGHLIRTARKFENAILRRFDLVTTVSPRMLDTLESKGVRRKRLALFPNWVDITRIHPLENARTIRTELGIPSDACVVLYSGSMGHKQGLDVVIAAARILAKTPSSEIFFVLAGTGPARAELEKSATGLPNVKLLPLSPEDRFNTLLNVADIHLLPQRRDASDLVMPSKLGPMLAVGKPVVATVPEDSQVSDMIGGAGNIVPAEDPSALVAALQQLAGDPKCRAMMGNTALHIARTRYAADKILIDMENRLMDLIGAARLPERNAAEWAA